jgi:hypothetical protein
MKDVVGPRFIVTVIVVTLSILAASILIACGGLVCLVPGGN